MRRIAVLFAVAVAGVGMSAAHPKAATVAAGAGLRPLTYVAFGDSWPSGAHCGNCRTFVALYADGLAKKTGRKIRFTNLTQTQIPGTQLGETSKSLLSDIRSDAATRRAVTSADIIVISTGANDLEAAFGAYGAGKCGGSDHADCFRKVAAAWRTNFDAILVQIRKLRAGHATAIRVVTNSNEFLADPNFIAFGKDFGRTTGVLITKLMQAALCGPARAHSAVCVYLAPVLNGPKLTTPQDVNTPKAMASVARALLATGLPELR
jgi:lysophospholipase L1-like esterase